VQISVYLHAQGVLCLGITTHVLNGQSEIRMTTDTRFSSAPNAEPLETNRTDIVNVGQNDMQCATPCFVSGRFWVRILATTSDSLILSGLSIRPQIVPSTSFLILHPLPFLQFDALKASLRFSCRYHVPRHKRNKQSSQLTILCHV